MSGDSTRRLLRLKLLSGRHTELSPTRGPVLSQTQPPPPRWMVLWTRLSQRQKCRPQVLTRFAVGEPLAAAEDMQDSLRRYGGPIDPNPVNILLPAGNPGTGTGAIDFHADSAFEEILLPTLPVTRLKMRAGSLD